MKSSTSRIYGAAAIVTALALSILFVPEAAYASEQGTTARSTSQAVTVRSEQASSFQQGDANGDEAGIDLGNEVGVDTEAGVPDLETGGTAPEQTPNDEGAPVVDSATESDAEGTSEASNGGDVTADDATNFPAQSIQDQGGAVFGCAAGSLYSIKANGGVRALQRDQETDEVAGSDVSAWGNSRFTGTRKSANGLGIGASGDVAYAYERSENALNVGQIMKYTRSGSTNTWSLEGTSYFETNLSEQALVTGAVDLSNNTYMFGGYDYDSSLSSTNYVFKLFMFDESEQGNARFVRVAYFDTGIAKSNTQATMMNGDMAFNDDGDLFVLRSGATGNNQKDSTTALFVISKDDLAAAVKDAGNLNPIAFQKFKDMELQITSVNGIAFGANGSLYMGTATDLYRYDPNTLNLIKEYPGVLENSTDLASCVSPSSVTMRKTLPDGRIHPDDQFTFSLESQGGTADLKTTEGNKIGLQDAVQGPIPAMQGTQFTVHEEMAKGSDSDLNMYTASWECTDGQKGTLAAGDNVVTVKDAGVALVCTITNEIDGTANLTWTKTDEDGEELPGSVWQITGTASSDPTFSEIVADCSSADQCNDFVDQDNRGGQFLVPNVPFGTYILKELAAPAGFVPVDIQVVITVNQPNFYAGSFVNSRVQAATVTATKRVLDTSGNPVSGESTGWSMETVLKNSDDGVELVQAGARDTDQESADRNSASTVPWSIAFDNTTAQTSAVVSETFSSRQTGAYDYVTVECTNGTTAIGNPAVTTETVTTADGDVTKVSVQVDSIKSGSNVQCAFTNQRKAGTLTWEKRGFDDSKLLLSGSVWRITQADGTTVDVADNVGNDSPATRDVDERPGYFKIQDLEWGTYVAREIESPLGYLVGDFDSSIVIDADNLNASFGLAFLNEQTEVPPLPLTGGTGRDLFIVGGIALLVLAGLGETVRRLRHSRRRSHM